MYFILSLNVNKQSIYHEPFFQRHDKLPIAVNSILFTQRRGYARSEGGAVTELSYPALLAMV